MKGFKLDDNMIRFRLKQHPGFNMKRVRVAEERPVRGLLQGCRENSQRL